MEVDDENSSNHQKQKTTQLKSQRITRGILKNTPVIAIGLLATVSLGASALTNAHTSHTKQQEKASTQTSSSESTPPPQTYEGDFSSTPSATSNTTGHFKVATSGDHNTSLTINGTQVPVSGQDAGQQSTPIPSQGNVSIDIVIDGQSSSSTSTTSSTDISINSFSSSQGDEPIRGSPRR